MIGHTLKLDLDTDRHLIVGDLHGWYNTFMRLLEKANYDPTKDVIYSVGDLIDRGPQSVEIIEFFQRERCYAVKGNHELMMLDNQWFETWISNGGINTLESVKNSKVEFGWFCDLIRPLPWVIDVGDNEDEHAFRIIHAEVAPGWPESYFQRMLNDAIDHNDVSLSRCLWSRKLIQSAQANAAMLKPTDYKINFHKERFRTVFTGHTPINKAFKCGDHWFIDTFRNKTLTMIDAVTKETFVEQIIV